MAVVTKISWTLLEIFALFVLELGFLSLFVGREFIVRVEGSVEGSVEGLEMALTINDRPLSVHFAFDLRTTTGLRTCCCVRIQSSVF